MTTQGPAAQDWGWEITPGPTTNTDQAASTSALLRKLNDELNQLRRDYSAILLERNQAWSQLANAEQVIRSSHERGEADRADLATWRKVGQDAIAKAHWIVARDGGRNCERCEGEIRRGEAYELQAGTGGLIAHIRCPRPKKRRASNRARAYQLTDKGRAATETIDTKES